MSNQTKKSKPPDFIQSQKFKKHNTKSLTYSLVTPTL